MRAQRTATGAEVASTRSPASARTTTCVASVSPETDVSKYLRFDDPRTRPEAGSISSQRVTSVAPFQLARAVTLPPSRDATTDGGSVGVPDQSKVNAR